MNKKYFFLAGLPRAGNTLFANIMNQNPDIATTANSPVAELVHVTTKLYNDEILNNFPDPKSIDNVVKNIIPNYYSDWPQKYIIDRQAWGHEILIKHLEKHLTNDIKVIVLVRPLEEILASFIKISMTTTSNFIKDSSDTVEKQCDMLMKNNGMIDLQLKSMKNLIKFENRGLAHFIEYDDLVNNTKSEIGKVYDFLGINKFEHTYTNLKQYKVNGVSYDDSQYGVNLHKIKTDCIKRDNYDIHDYLSKELIEKCKSINFWKDRY